MASPSASGGFFQPSTLTPPMSSVASSSAGAGRLPNPRSKPLKAGGPKESAFIRYVDERIRQIQRRYAKRGPPGEVIAIGGVKGYTSLTEACKDIDELIDVVWVSGTPSLQVAYLLSVCDLFNGYLKGFPPAPKALFRTLDKLDHAFASLLQGRDIETGEALPGFEGGRGVNSTEKVRINSMVHYARAAVVDVMAKYEPGMDDEEEPETAEESAVEVDDGIDLDVDEDFDAQDVEGAWDMRVAKVFDKTLVELGDALTNAPPIGLRIEREKEMALAAEQ